MTPSEKKYLFRFTTELETSVVMSGNTYNEARHKALAWIAEQMNILKEDGVDASDWDRDFCYSEGEVEPFDDSCNR